MQNLKKLLLISTLSGAILNANIISPNLLDTKQINNIKTTEIKKDGLDDITNETINKWELGYIKFRAYKENYAVLSYLSEIPTGSPNEAKNFKKHEVKFQFSFRGDILIDFFPNYNFLISGAYTQVSNWQQFIESAPFRDTNYKPEVFLTFPIKYELIDNLYLKDLNFGYKHSSNGMSQTLDSNGQIDRNLSMSRSWNRMYVAGTLKYKNFFVKSTLWHRISENIETDDNPNIEKYYGDGEVEVDYILGDSITKLFLRTSFEDFGNKGSVKFNYTYPIVKKKNLLFYMEAFHGYGYSLLDYDRSLTQVGIGISISR